MHSSQNLYFCSDPEDLKSRLSRDSSSSLICPRRDGCTLTIALRPKSNGTEGTTRAGGSRSQALSLPKAPHGDMVIAALRILVGSTSSYIPSKIYVQGRPVDLTPRVKKWYSLPLTDEEIALSIRNGILSVGIGQAFDSSSNIVVDSVEVYAAERSSIETWLPKSYFPAEGTFQPDLRSPSPHPSSAVSEKEHDVSNGLILSARALSFLCELVGSTKLISDTERSFLRQLVQDTALDRDKIVSKTIHTLLERLEPDGRSRKSFYDESILFGCSKALSRSKEIVNESVMMDFDEDASRWGALRLVLQDCLQAASSIARERPMNYLQSMENIVESDFSSGSVAVDASKMLLEGLRRSSHFEDLVGGPGGIIDLSLTEMAIERNTDAPHSKQFAKFDDIRRFLESNKAPVVDRCCEAISTFCRNHGGAERAANETPDLFTLLQHARLVAYQCDSCALCPMKGTRYTLLEEDYDIE